ncbi:hypothetical protein [Pseudoxanthomonas composti]|uniref:Uncharacterized protein n=1 Tax=Pseudoxanthomonas composti TaxID=2137479 RepID=A0A4Q1JTV8_9GAMM|nr:hypothetical protein [Pseudoxanthomonas composti]RXR03540.1 hypothetical protein EPA99_14025 [Pseudoxanthomonas composti]
MDHLIAVISASCALFSLGALCLAYRAFSAVTRLERKFDHFDGNARLVWDTALWQHARTEALLKGEEPPRHPSDTRTG